MFSRALHTDDFFLLFADDALRTLRLERTANPFHTTEDIERAFDALEKATADVDADWALLIDLRSGPLRNDPEFERILARARARVFARFGRLATVAQSAVGKLQIKRHAREDGVAPPRLFDDEESALAWLAAR